MSGVKVRYCFERKGRRKASPESAQAAPTAPSRVARMLALAYLVERLVDDGQLQSYAEAARLLGITRSRMGQVMGLLNLPLETQEKILTGELRVSERSLRSQTRRG